MKMRLVGALVLLAASLTAAPEHFATAQQVTPCDQQGQSDRSRVTRKAAYAFREPEIATLESKRDGATIQIGVLRPRVPAGKRVPVIVEASPYFHALQSLDLRACSPFLADNYVPQGYAVALVPLRGTADNGGCFDFFGPLERSDLDQAITWLGSRPWSNGRVAIAGKSSDGASAWEVAAFGNRYLKTIVPVSGVPDPFDLLFGAGVNDWRAPGILTGVYFAQSLLYLQGRSPQHTAEVAACPDYAVAEAASLYSSATGDIDPFGYWAQRAYTSDISRRYRGSVFFIHGLQDWNVNPGSQFPFITDLAARGVPMKMLLGQWGHSWPDEEGPPELRADFADILLRWFDRWLKDDRRVSTGPAVQVEDSSGMWRNDTSWPPPGRRTTLWLSPSGTLDSSPSRAQASTTVGPDPFHVQDPAGAQGSGVGELPSSETLRANCEQPLCAAFRAKPVAAPYRISGIPRLRIPAVPKGVGGSLSIYLYTERADTLRRIGWGQVDLRFPHGRGKPQPVGPGERVSIDVRLQPLDAMLARGERLVLMVSMANSYNRLPLPGAPVELDVGGASASLELLHVTPKRSQFFTPPKPRISLG